MRSHADDVAVKGRATGTRQETDGEEGLPAGHSTERHVGVKRNPAAAPAPGEDSTY